MKQFYTLWLCAITLTAAAAAGISSLFEENRILDESRARASFVLSSIEDSTLFNYRAKHFDRIARIAQRLKRDHQILAIVFCRINPPHFLGFPHKNGNEKEEGWGSLCLSPQINAAKQSGKDISWSTSLITSNAHGKNDKIKVEYTVHPLEWAGKNTNYFLVLAQNLNSLKPLWILSFLKVFLLTWSVATGVLILATRQTRTWFSNHIRSVHIALTSALAGHRVRTVFQNKQDSDLPPEFKPITRDIHQIAAKILVRSASRTKEDSQNSREEFYWIKSLKQKMSGKNLIVVANRQPYIHQKFGDQVKIMRPASGLVTALEPILRQCGGLWVAHGNGTGDREMSGADGDVSVPPDRPSYTLKRLWLTTEEEQGYYYGFSNEGLWPLCHLAHTRPVFRLSDWSIYNSVNQRFCDAVPARHFTESSLILVQDYHFALLPRMLKTRHPGAAPRIGIFWHIPWPNPEAFGICPWGSDLLKGMLGADVIGFHTQYHCNNFLETCNRYLEARIDWEHFSVTMENHETLVRAFPIGIDTSPVRFISDLERQNLKNHYGIKADLIAVGVDRMDYTKGLVERMTAVDHFLEKHPHYLGRFSLVQMGSPSRVQISAYRNLVDEVKSTADNINSKWKSKLGPNSDYKPIVLLPEHHDWDEIRNFYQLGDVCMVTSLHDGMNLVAKEYIWCQRPDRGSLILSKFTGASRELNEAFIVNPYSIEEISDSLAAALSLSSEERIRRMSLMREKIRNHNAYHWAADLIQTLIQKEGENEFGKVVSA